MYMHLSFVLDTPATQRVCSIQVGTLGAQFEYTHLVTSQLKVGNGSRRALK